MKLLPEGPPDLDIEGAWIAEAKRRHQELLDRRVKGILGEQVFANVRALLARWDTSSTPKQRWTFRKQSAATKRRMALSEFEKRRAEKTVGAYIEKTRPPPHIRPELDLGFRVSGRSVEIFEVSPHWERPEETMEHSVAKATFVRRQGISKVYWQRADLKWHRYEPMPEARTLEEFLAVVEKDEYPCFWG